MTFPGPGENIERLRVPENRLQVTPAVEAQLNERQKSMANRLVRGEELTSRKCQELYGVSYQAIYEDFKKLTGLGIAPRSVPDVPHAMCITLMNNHQLIINQLLVIINLISRNSLER
ncbi:MAG TPA: hypothetical protein DCY27_07450 [Desulfobacterales bacterium]|nr:hypothetical protein [Desulfobacterales bacterium]